MKTGLILFLAGGLLILLLYFEKREYFTGKLVTKPLLSLLFIIAAISKPHPQGLYFYFLVCGLVLCLFGDVFLIFSTERLFLSGLVSFLLGHVAYSCGFLTLAEPSRIAWALTAVLAVTGGGIFRWLKPYLGPMLPAVGIYIVVITVMVAGAAAVWSNPDLFSTGRAMVLAGAICFYLSDISVARNRFITNAFVNRLWGLPLYYGAQFLLAFSAGQLV